MNFHEIRSKKRDRDCQSSLIGKRGVVLLMHTLMSMIKGHQMNLR